MLITPELSAADSSSFTGLLDLIEARIAVIGRLTYEEVAFGLETCRDYRQEAQDLIAYREIISRRMAGCGCCDGTPIKNIISKIKHLTNS